MLGILVEIPAAILVFAEVTILFSGVVARYGLHSPLMWSDELASILFLWLAMLGAAVAFRRSEHMRMTALVANVRPSLRAYLDVVATCAALAFLLLVMHPAYRSFVIALPAPALPLVIRYAVVEGIVTATEVSTIGIVYAIVVGLLVYRRFDWRRLMPMLIETACLSGAILLIIGSATGNGMGLTQSGFSHALVTAMIGLPGGAASFIAVSIIAFVILGSVLEGIPAIVLFGPLLFPIARAVGVHEVHYAMIIILAMGGGLFAPPFGVGDYAACAIGRVEPADGIRPIWGYLLSLLIGLIIVAMITWISIGFL